jgi:pimeloyl-ACP methyl ester carboxylesterase
LTARKPSISEAVTSVFSEVGEESDLLPLLANISAPTLLIRAGASFGTALEEAAWEQARKYLPTNSRAVQINGAIHNVHHSTFDEFMQAVNDFLSQ